MLTTFLATINPMLMLFTCIAIGFVLGKLKILPDNASTVLAKLVTWVFAPALSFYTMSFFCTVENISTHATNLVLSIMVFVFALMLAIFLARFFIRQKKAYEYNVYKYALTFGNFGYVGDPLVLAILGDVGLAYFKLCSLPVSILVYAWGLTILIPKEKRGNKNPLINILSAPIVALFIGMVVGLSGIGEFLMGPVGAHNFFGNTATNLKACLGPAAMLIAGLTIAKYNFLPMLKNIKVYIVSMFRLFILPAVLLAFLYCIKGLASLAFGLYVDNLIFHLIFFIYATPLGLNTVVFPEAFGCSPKTGASMAMISHTLCVITIPIMYALICVLFPV